MLPVAHSRVNLKDVHPELLRRAGQLFAHPLLEGKLVVVSGARLVGNPDDLDKGIVNTSWYFWIGYQRT